MKIGLSNPVGFAAFTQRKVNQPALQLSTLQADTVSFTARKKLSPQEKLEATREHYNKALKEGYALPALNVNGMEQIQGIVKAANEKKSPVIIQASAGARKYAGLDYLVGLVQTARKDAKVPLMLHLDHGTTFNDCKECIDAGFDSVMIDGSHLPYEENIALTKKVVDYAHKKGVFVEAELGRLAGIEDNIRVAKKDANYTDPQEAARFVKETGCDSLAISIGTSHGPVKFGPDEVPEIDFARLAEIKKAVENVTGKPYPFVLHGASSSPKEFYEKLNDYVVIPSDLTKCSIIPKELSKKVLKFLNSPMIKQSPEINKEAESLKKEFEKYSPPEGKGVPEEMYNQATKEGIAKLNVDSDFRALMTASIKESMGTNRKNIDPRKYNGASRTAVTEVAMRKMDVLNSSGKAE